MDVAEHEMSPSFTNGVLMELVHHGDITWKLRYIPLNLGGSQLAAEWHCSI